MQRGLFQISIEDISATVNQLKVNAKGGLVVGITATLGGKPLPRGAAPFIYYNLGPYVPDPNGTYERIGRDGEITRYRLDPEAALENAVLGTLMAYRRVMAR